MEKTFDFLKKRTQVNYLATLNGNVPSCRPFGDPVLFDNKIYILTNKNKNVSKQIASTFSLSSISLQFILIQFSLS